MLRHPVARNATALYVAQLAVTVLPLLTLPFLARALGASQLGVVVLVQSFSFLLTVVIEFGFGLSAARDVARRREDPRSLFRMVAAVQGAKLLLCAGAALVAFAALPVVPVFREDPGLVGLALLLALLQGLHPAWFFSGLEKLRLLAAIDLGTRLLGVVLIVALVDGPEDVALTLWIYVATIGLGTGVLQVLLYREVPLRLPTWTGTRAALGSSATLFATHASVSLYTSANVFLLGLLVPSAQVAYFGSAEKAVRAVMRVLGGAASAVYPRVNFLIGKDRADRANRLALLTLLVFGGAGALSALGLIALAPFLVELLFGPGFAPTVPVLRVLSLLIPISICASLLSSLWLLPRRLDRLVLRVVIGVGLLNVVLVLATVPSLGLQAAAWAVVVSELVALGAVVLLVRRMNVNPAEVWTEAPPGQVGAAS